MATKAQIINDAYSQLRISGITVIPNANEIELALQRLEDMMHEFSGRNICIGYNFEESPDPNTDTWVKPQFNQCLKSNLAIRLVPDYDKNVPAILMAQAKQSLSAASAAVAGDYIREVQPSVRMPRGSGNTIRYNRWRRFNTPENLPPNECATKRITEGDINDYREDFTIYLEGEDIIAYEITSDSAIEIQSSSNETPSIKYRVKTGKNAADGVWQQVKIELWTDTGRFTTRIIDFEISPNVIVGGG
jgi:hypothetical protein